MDDVDLGIGEERVEVVAALLGRAGHVVVPPVDSRRQLDAVALILPPLDAPEKVRAVLPRARGSRDADRSAVRKGAGEEGGRFQEVNLTASRIRVRAGPAPTPAEPAGRRKEPEPGRGDGRERVRLHAGAAGVAARGCHRRLLRIALEHAHSVVEG
jgi:hypothetical protein